MNPMATRTPMRPRLLLCCTIAIAALALAASAAQADQARLAWGDCAGGSGTSVTSFACNTNTGRHVLVGSFILDQPFISNAQWGIEAEMYFSTSSGIYYGSPVSDWWRAQSGGCRDGVVQVSTDFGSLPPSSCVDPFLPLSGSQFTVVDTPDPRHGGLHYARLLLQVATDNPLQLDTGVEYLAFRVIVPHLKTAGDGACAGCCESMYAIIQSFRLAGLPSEGDRFLPRSETVQWQGSIGCGPTESAKTTWGQVRALYR